MSLSLSVPRRAGRCAAAIVTVAASLIATAPAATAASIVTVSPRSVLTKALHDDQVTLARLARELEGLAGSGAQVAQLQTEVRADRLSAATLRAMVGREGAACRRAAAWKTEERLTARVKLVHLQTQLATTAATDAVYARLRTPIDVTDATVNMSPAHAARARAAVRDLAAAGAELTKMGDTVSRLLRVPPRHASTRVVNAQARMVRAELRTLRRSSQPASARSAMTRLGQQLELAGYGIAPRPGQRYAASTRAASRAVAARLTAVLTRLLNLPAPVAATYWAPLRARLVQWRAELGSYQHVLRASRDQHLIGLTIQLVAARHHDVAALTRAISLAGRAARLSMVTGGHGDSPQLRTQLLQRLTTGAISQEAYDSAIVALVDRTRSLAVLEWPAADLKALLDPAGPGRFTRDAALVVYVGAVERAAAAKAQLVGDERAVTAALS